MVRLAHDEPSILLKYREGTISTPFRKIFAIICLSPVFAPFRKIFAIICLSPVFACPRFLPVFCGHLKGEPGRSVEKDEYETYNHNRIAGRSGNRLYPAACCARKPEGRMGITQDIGSGDQACRFHLAGSETAHSSAR
jgi:hypothetical protein